MRQLRAYYNGNDTVFAYSKKDARDLLKEIYGEEYSDEWYGDLIICDNNEKYILYQEEIKSQEYLIPENSKIGDKEEFSIRVEAKLSDWMNLIGRGLLGSENY